MGKARSNQRSDGNDAANYSMELDTIKDAEKVVELLKGYEVVTLYEEEATREAIVSTFPS